MKRAQLRKLTTEAVNAATGDLDRMSALEIARLINAEDATIAAAVRRALPQIARAIEAIAGTLGRGGRLIYVGTGTSGRIAALDASECPPTFGSDPSMVQYVIAGGDRALGHATEASEDSRAAGQRDLALRKPGKQDVVVGITASGRTPYTVAALAYARRRGATTIAVTCNRGSELGRTAHIIIVADVGPEVLSGSTRMKAGTAQKMILNMLSTGAMARLGYVYGNLMVNVHMTNEKLWERGISILQRTSGAARTRAEAALKAAGSVPVALLMLETGLNKVAAERRLRKSQGDVRRALESVKTR